MDWSPAPLRLTFYVLPAWATAWEEGVAYNLARLSSGRVVIRPEVRTVLRRPAHPPAPAALIPAHHTARGQPLHEVVEGRTDGHVLEALAGRRVGEACR